MYLTIALLTAQLPLFPPERPHKFSRKVITGAKMQKYAPRAQEHTLEASLKLDGRKLENLN